VKSINGASDFFDLKIPKTPNQADFRGLYPIENRVDVKFLIGRVLLLG